MTKPDAMGPIIALESTVTGGRTIQAYKRGGDDEARERLIEETTGAVVWLGGVKFLNWVGDKILDRFFGGNFDVGTDKILRTPFDNFMMKNSSKKFNPKLVALIKASKVLASVVLADIFIGLVVPPLNQKLTRKIRKKREENNIVADNELLNNKTNQNQNQNQNVAFKGALEAINVFTHAIENTNTGKLLSTDAGLVSGRLYSARNKEERHEIAIRDIGSIYFYMWAQNHVGSLMNFIETGRFTRLNPETAVTLDNYLNEIISEHGGEMDVKEFKKIVLGDKSKTHNVVDKINFETAKLSKIQTFLNKHRKTPIEPLQVAKVSDIKPLIRNKHLMSRIIEMSKLQPERRGEAVITKQQILDAINECKINNPEFLDKVFSDFTGGKVDKKTGIYKPGASKDPYKFVSNKKLYNLKAQMEDYVEDLCKKAKNGKITKDLLKNTKFKNLAWSSVNFVAGFLVAATFLSTLIPKFQYWYTRRTTGKNEFPGLNDSKNDREIAKA